MTTLDVTWSNHPLFWLSRCRWLMATATCRCGSGCQSLGRVWTRAASLTQLERQSLTLSYFFSLFSSTSRVSSPTIFISLTPLSPSLASVPQAPLTLWYEGTGLPTQWQTYQERQEVEFAHHQWTGNESYQTFTSSVAITQPIVEPTYNQGKGTLLCATKDSVAALTPYILFNSKNDCFQSLPIKTATQS